MTDQDESDGNDLSPAVPKRGTKLDSKEGIRMQIKAERLTAGEANGEETAEMETSMEQENTTKDAEERITSQERSGTNDLEEYSLFMSATDDSSTDSAEEAEADGQTDLSEKNKRGAKDKNVAPSHVNSRSNSGQQHKVLVRNIKKDSLESAVASVVPRIKKEMNAVQPASSESNEQTSDGVKEMVLPVLSRVKKEPVSMPEVMSMDNEQESSTCSPDCDCKDCEARSESSSDRLSSMVRRTYSGPIRRQIVKTKDGGKRTFMILNKNSLRALEARGLIQHVKTIGNGQTSTKPVIACKSLLNAIQQDKNKLSAGSPTKNKEPEQPGLPSRVELPTPVTSASGESPVVVSWAAQSAVNTSAITFTIQLPGKDNPGGTPQKASPGTNLRQIVTPPVFIQSSSTNPNLTPSNQLKQYKMKSEVTSTQLNSSGLTYTSGGTSHPSVSFSQLTSTPSCTSTSKLLPKSNTSQSPIENMEMSCDSPPPGPSSPQEGLEDGDDDDDDRVESIALPEELLNGPFKVKKGLKIFKCDRSTQSNQASMKNVKWIALPTLPVSATVPVRAPVPPNFRKTQPTLPTNSLPLINLPAPNSVPQASMTSSINLPVSSQSSPFITNITKDVFRDSERKYEGAKKALKEKYKRLLNKHRQRYYLLLKKFRGLERRFSAVEDSGTREQVVRDARRYLSEDHLLFMESQMFLRNRTGKGNRFSKKFIRLMIRLYESSPAGYRFLRTVFTIPSVKTVQKWQNRLFDILDDNEKDPLDITGNVGATGPPAVSITSGDGFILQSEPVATTSSEQAVDRAFQGSTTLFRSVEAPERAETDRSSSGSGSEDSEDGGEEEDLDEEEEEDFDEEMQTEQQAEKSIYQNSTARSAADEITIAWEEPWSTVIN